MPSLTRHSTPYPRGQVDAADHEGDEDGRRVEAAPRAGAHPDGAAVRDRDAPRAEQPRDARRSGARTRCSTSGARRGPAARRCSSSSPRIAACAAASTPTPSRAPAPSSSRTRRGKWRSASSAAAAATISPAAASRSATNRSTCSRRCSTRTRRRSRRPAVEAFTTGQVDSVYLVYNEFRSVISQRIVVERLLPIPRLEIEPTAGGAPPIDYLYEPTPEELFTTAPAAARRGAGVPRAARVERRVLRRADDGDGFGVAQRGGDDRPAHALHEQGSPGGDHARDYRGRVAELKELPPEGGGDGSIWQQRQQQHRRSARWSRSSDPSSTSNSRAAICPPSTTPCGSCRARRRRRRDRRRRGGRAAPRREPRAHRRDEGDRRHAPRHEGRRHRCADLDAGRHGDARPRA